MSFAEIVIQAGWLRTAPSSNLHPEKVANDDRVVCHDWNPSSCIAHSFQGKNWAKKWFERRKINGTLGRLSWGVGCAEIWFGVDGLKQLMSWALFLWTKQQRIAKPIFIGTFSIEVLLIYYRLKSVKSFVSYYLKKPNVHITLPTTNCIVLVFSEVALPLLETVFCLGITQNMSTLQGITKTLSLLNLQTGC